MCGQVGRWPCSACLPQELGILLGNPVHEQGDQHRDHQGTCGHLVLDGGDDRRRDHCSVDPRRPPASGVRTLEPLLLICLPYHPTSTSAIETAVVTRGE